MTKWKYIRTCLPRWKEVLKVAGVAEGRHRRQGRPDRRPPGAAGEAAEGGQGCHRGIRGS
jgi:hypothetical protein